MLAIIPARGGSKGLPGKNIKNLCGIPLICHTIKAALASNLVSRVVVSTDDSDIASIAKDCGAEVPFIRSIDLAGDDSMAMDVYLDMVDKITIEKSQPVESFVALLPTAPLRVSEDIDKAICIFNDKNADSVISVTESMIPVQWHRKITSDGVLCDYFPGNDSLLNRQKLEETYVPNGAIYIFRSEILRTTRQYYTKKTYPYIMPRNRSVDIDEMMDFEWAEFCMSREKKMCENPLKLNLDL